MSNALRNSSLLAGNQVKSVTGLRQPFFSSVNARPTTLGNHNSVVSAFNGDLSRLILPIEHRITGASTLGTPATGYLYTDETAALYCYSYNASGHNQSTSGNEGRTAATALRVRFFQQGQGDHMGLAITGFVTGTKAGSTSFLANPAGVMMAGGVEAGSDGVLLGNTEYVNRDNGYDVASIPMVMTGFRTNATGAKEAFWSSFRSQSKGTQPFDQAYGVFGPHRYGLDLTPATITGAGVAMRAGNKILFNATGDWRFCNNEGGEWVAYSSGAAETQFFGNGAPQFSVGRTASAVNYIQAFGAATTAFPGFLANGSDTNISIGYRTKGTGAHFFYTAGGASIQFATGNTASAVNYLRAFGAAAAGTTYFEAQGSDTDIPVLLATKGTGAFSVRTGGAGGTTQFRITSEGSIGIRDGVAEPTTVTGFAQIYVDTADGDLKVKFSDGTVKTIVTDN